MIAVTYRSVDRVRIARKFKTVEGARRFATKYVGDHPEIGPGYAVSGDGIGKVTAQGITIAALFADEPKVPSSQESDPYDAGFDDYRPYRVKGCTCCDHGLVHVGCECGADELPF